MKYCQIIKLHSTLVSTMVSAMVTTLVATMVAIDVPGTGLRVIKSHRGFFNVENLKVALLFAMIAIYRLAQAGRGRQ